MDSARKDFLSAGNYKPHRYKAKKQKYVDISDDHLEVLNTQLPQTEKTNNSPQMAACRTQDETYL